MKDRPCHILYRKGKDTKFELKFKIKVSIMKMVSIDEKIAAKIKQLIMMGWLDPSKIEDYEKKVGIKLNLSDKELAIAMSIYENRKMFRKK